MEGNQRNHPAHLVTTQRKRRRKEALDLVSGGGADIDLNLNKPEADIDISGPSLGSFSIYFNVFSRQTEEYHYYEINHQLYVI